MKQAVRAMIYYCAAGEHEQTAGCNSMLPTLPKVPCMQSSMHRGPRNQPANRYLHLSATPLFHQPTYHRGDSHRWDSHEDNADWHTIVIARGAEFTMDCALHQSQSHETCCLIIELCRFTQMPLPISLYIPAVCPSHHRSLYICFCQYSVRARVCLPAVTCKHSRLHHRFPYS